MACRPKSNLEVAGAIGVTVLSLSDWNTLLGCRLVLGVHPWAGKDLSLKIDERDQTIWICILEL